MLVTTAKTQTGGTDKPVQPDTCEHDLEKLYQDVLDLRKQVRAAEQAIGGRGPTPQTS